MADVGPWFLTDGTKAFNNKANLMTIPLAEISRNEQGNAVSNNFGVWTGTLNGGTGLVTFRPNQAPATIGVEDAIFLVGDKQFLFSRTYRLNAPFDNVAGLDQGAPVRAGGVRVGTVDHIQMPRQADGKVVVAMDAPVCRAWAKLMHRRPDALAEDAFIAATAIVHHMVVVTRNVRDFKTLGVRTLNPFDRAQRD